MQFNPSLAQSPPPFSQTFLPHQDQATSQQHQYLPPQGHDNLANSFAEMGMVGAGGRGNGGGGGGNGGGGGFNGGQGMYGGQGGNGNGNGNGGGNGNPNAMGHVHTQNVGPRMMNSGGRDNMGFRPHVQEYSGPHSSHRPILTGPAAVPLPPPKPRGQQPNPSAPPFVYGAKPPAQPGNPQQQQQQHQHQQQHQPQQQQHQQHQHHQQAQFDPRMGHGQMSPNGMGLGMGMPMSPQGNNTGGGGMRQASGMPMGMQGQGGRGGMGDGNFGGWMDGGMQASGLSPSIAQQLNNFAATTMPSPASHASNYRRPSQNVPSPINTFTPSSGPSMTSPNGLTSPNTQFSHNSALQQQEILQQQAQTQKLHGPQSSVDLDGFGSNDIVGMGGVQLATLPSTNSLSSLGSGQDISDLAAGQMIGGLLDDEVIPTAIVIKNIPFAVQKETLLAIMESLGAPLPYAFNYHQDNGIFRGLAFANFRHPHEADAVVRALNGYDISGRKLRVEYKKVLQAGEKERIEREKALRRMRSMNQLDGGGDSRNGGSRRERGERGGRNRGGPREDRQDRGDRIDRGESELVTGRYPASGVYPDRHGGGGARSVSQWNSSVNGNLNNGQPVQGYAEMQQIPYAMGLSAGQAAGAAPSLGPMASFAATTPTPLLSPELVNSLLSPTIPGSLGNSPLLNTPMGQLAFPISLSALHNGQKPNSPSISISSAQAMVAFPDKTPRDRSPARSLTPASAGEAPVQNLQQSRRVSAVPSTQSSHSSGAPGATISLDLNDPNVLDIYSRVLLFKEDRMRDELAFSRTLTVKERRIVHMVAQKLGMHHYSAGEGIDRYAVVSRFDGGGQARRTARNEPITTNVSAGNLYPYHSPTLPPNDDEVSDPSGASPHLKVKKSMPNMTYLNGPSVTQNQSNPTRLLPQRSSGNLRDYTTVSGGGMGGTIKNAMPGEGPNASQMFNNLFGSSLTAPLPLAQESVTKGQELLRHPHSAPSTGGFLTPLDNSQFGYGHGQQGFAQQQQQQSPVETSSPVSPMLSMSASGISSTGQVLRQPREPTGTGKGFIQRSALRPAGSEGGSPILGPGPGLQPQGQVLGQRVRSDASSLNTSGSSVIEEGNEGDVDEEDDNAPVGQTQ